MPHRVFHILKTLVRDYPHGSSVIVQGHKENEVVTLETRPDCVHVEYAILKVLDP